MLFAALEAGGNYSALLRVIDIGVQKAQAILDIPLMDIEGRGHPSLPAARERRNAPLDISANDISFAYDKKKIIDGVSLQILERSKVAIVGPSGGGKTTLCHLLSRFWDVDKGSVALGGVDVRDWSMDDLMANFSFVFQNVYLFHDTIANNIRFGQPDAPMKKVIAAAKKACCHDFISALPNGYDTVIGEAGASLSGGEKQRISIARAIMKDAPIIILDEATANVDPENERDLMAAVSELTKEKTVIMIAHRLKTVRDADQIIVIDKGKIAEQGKHRTLAKSDGIYSRFIDSRKQAVSWKI
jgi:ATP-binding cassette subfamily B protein